MTPLTSLLLATIAACLLPFAPSTQAADAKPADKAKAPPPVRSDPVLRDLEGWTVHVEPALRSLAAVPRQGAGVKK